MIDICVEPWNFEDKDKKTKEIQKNANKKSNIQLRDALC